MTVRNVISQCLPTFNGLVGRPPAPPVSPSNAVSSGTARPQRRSRERPPSGLHRGGNGLGSGRRATSQQCPVAVPLRFRRVFRMEYAVGCGGGEHRLRQGPGRGHGRRCSTVSRRRGGCRPVGGCVAGPCPGARSVRISPRRRGECRTAGRGALGRRSAGPRKVEDAVGPHLAGQQPDLVEGSPARAVADRWGCRVPVGPGSDQQMRVGGLGPAPSAFAQPVGHKAGAQLVVVDGVDVFTRRRPCSATA